jgi:serine/threonine-protein kinase
MLDGEGKVRITDFGLAALAETLGGEDVRSGTPSFMSPEQLLGREVTVRSDIYSLGLVLYEIFTGRRAFSGRTLADLTRKHRDESPVEPSLLVPDIDPAVERAVLACLEKDPRRRPPSAIAVSALLSGKDPLEAAIAAGETPSPELVAAAGEREGLRPAVAWGLVALAFVDLILAPLAARSVQLIDRVPVGKAPAVLEDRAREFLARMGAAGTPADSATGFSIDDSYLRHVERTDRSTARWDNLASGAPPVVQLWYRQSPRPLVSFYLSSRVHWEMPAQDVSGMAGLGYDMAGRLTRFYSVPPQLEGEAEPSTPLDWGPLFAEAGLDPERFRPVEPRWTPPFYVDTRAAWEGTWPERDDLPLRIEAAAYRGRPVWFEVVYAWTHPHRMERFPWPKGQHMALAMILGVLLLLVAVGGLMARRNIALGRGDRRGAARIALLLVGFGIGAWVLSAHHVEEPAAEAGLAARGAGMALLWAAILWLFYLALEPYVRRSRPWTLISWTRLLSAGTGDPIVGRDVLVGLAWGTTVTLLIRPLFYWLPRWLRQPVPAPEAGYLDSLLGLRPLLGLVLDLGVSCVLVGMTGLLLFVVLRLILRWDGLAAAGMVAILIVPSVAKNWEQAWLLIPLVTVWLASWVFVLLRFGLLAAVVGMFVADLLGLLPLTLDPSGWTAGPTVLAFVLLIALAALAVRGALGGPTARRRHAVA